MILKTSSHNLIKTTKFEHQLTHSGSHSISLLFLLFIFFLFLSSSNAQVKIKEKVEIKPSTSIQITKGSAKTTSENYSLRATHYWTQFYTGENNDIPLFRMRFKITSFCSDIIYSHFDYSGNLEFNLTELKGTSYTISLLLSERTAWDSVYKYEGLHGAPFQVYVDGEFVKDANNSTSVSPWFGYLGIYVYGSEMIFDNSGIKVTFDTHQACSSIIGRLYEDWPTITITEGSQYLSFFAWEKGDTLGDSFYSGDYLHDNFPLLIYDKPLYNNSDLDAIIMAEVNGVTAFDTVKIIKVGDFELDVQLLPVEIAPSEESDVLLQQVTYTGLQDFPEEQLFDVEIIEGGEYGTIISSNGVDKSDSFTQIEQGFKFIAEDDIDLDSVEVLIKVVTKIEEGAALSSLENSNLASGHKDSAEPNLNTKSKVAINPKSRSNQNNTAFIIIPPDEEREIFGVGSLKILNKDSIDHFQLTIIPDTLSSRDTIAFTEMARIIVEAKDEDSNDVVLDSTKVLKYEVTTNTNYGTFINSNGDTLKSSLVVLENISYADAKAGKIKFASVKENPDSVIKCNIKVSLQEDTTKNGKREAVVLEQTLKIVMTGDREVQLIITGHTNDPEHDTYIGQIELANRKPFRVRITRGGEIITNHKIRLKTNYVDGSGGHDHLIPRRPDSAFSYTRAGIVRNITTERIRRQNYGSFYSYSSGAVFNTDSLNGMVYERSKQDTFSRFEYVASIWGDSMIIYLESCENKLLKDSIKLVEKRSDLHGLVQGTNYALVGTPDNYVGTDDPCRYNPPTSLHFYSHFGTQTLNSAIQNIASDYSLSHPGIRIRINDISLEFGGKFDVNNNWRGGHSSHRIGTDADIGSTGLDENDNCVDINIEELRQIIEDRTELTPIYHDPPHFHISVNN
jgi:hypothetical protein